MTKTAEQQADIAIARTELEMARVATTIEERTQHLTEAQDIIGWTLADPEARSIWNEAEWMKS